MQQTSRRPPVAVAAPEIGGELAAPPARIRPARLTRGARKALLGVLFLVLGAGAGFAAMPLLFRVLPHGLLRLGTILAALEDDAGPNAVVFGSSVEMSAVDTRLLARELHRLSGGRGEEELIYNLSAEAQEPGEAALLYQELPPSVDLVIQFLRHTSLPARRHLWDGKFNGLYMFGYRPDERTIAALEGVYGPDARRMLERSAWSHHWQARAVPHAVLDVAMHRRVRRDVDFGRAERDLFFPSFGLEALPEAMMAAAFARNFHPEPGKRLQVSPESRAMLEEMCALATRTNPRRRVVFVMGLAHPHLRDLWGAQYFSDLERLTETRPCGGRAAFIDATDAVLARYYADELHLVPAGAEVFTRWLASRLAGAR